MTRILAIDPSLAGTGFALLEHQPPSHWHAQSWTRGRPGRRAEPLTERDRRITSIVADLHTVDLRTVDLAAIEQPAFGAPGGSTWDRAGLWWALVHRLVANDIPVIQVNSATRQKFAVGHAHSASNPVDKADVAVAASRMWPDTVITGNNAADAVVIASVAAVVLDLPVPFPLHQYRRTATAKIQLPDNLMGAA